MQVNDQFILEGLNLIKGRQYITQCYQTKGRVQKPNANFYFMCAEQNISGGSGNMCRGVMDKFLMEYVACRTLRAVF